MCRVLTLAGAVRIDGLESLMQRRSRLWIDPVLAAGTLLSLAFGIAFYFYGELDAVAIATFAGLLGIIITLQIQEITRERRRAEYESRMGAIIATLESSLWLPDLIEPMLASVRKVEQTHSRTPAVDACRQLLERCQAQLADLESGRFRYPYEDNALPLRLCQTLQREFLAISVPANDLRWWLTPEGRRYWQYQQQALDRGVVIRRVYIHDEWSPELAALAQEQRDAGAEVRRVHRDALPVGARGIIGIWDRTCGVEVTYDASGAAVFYSYSVAEADLDRLRRQFEQVERMAVDLDEPEPSAGFTGSGQRQRAGTGSARRAAVRASPTSTATANQTRVNAAHCVPGIDSVKISSPINSWTTGSTYCSRPTLVSGAPIRSGTEQQQRPPSPGWPPP